MSREPQAPSGGEPLSAAQLEGSVVAGGRVEKRQRKIIEERPLRIVVNDAPIATLMCTPGGETELALGFLVTEGIVASAAEVAAVSFCADSTLGEAGEARVVLAEGVEPLRRNYRDIFSSCSLCGDEWRSMFADGIASLSRPAGRLCAADVFAIGRIMSAGQPLFAATGGAHAAAVCETPVSEGSALTVVREDIGRHNALDKAVGAALVSRLRLDRSLLFLSSRLSFEMVAKAARAGIADVAGVSAPSAAAVRLAERLGMFLAGFARGESMTVYTGVEALDMNEESSR